ncbi:NBS-LRR type resistance protein [Cucumis melo var. makuwa]|uniref:NBS-LRR type resistance protein n=1 Tax=Cucumis melo var. makuwa TaxID=1194695 RepID=A0A5D3BT61_CUCMM|nr:NBS-LRR type resistance protein [Cucumis melo var. makuwa]TYK02334.1 NBS-LRR type resistance protein [Cucumis melo var. makuwa]
MVICESNASGSGDNKFYDVLDKVLDIQYLMGRSVWLFKCRWYDTDNKKSQRTHVTLRTDVDPTIIERSVMHHVADDYIDDGDEQLSHQSGSINGTMSSFSSDFKETYVMFLEFDKDLNTMRGSSSVDNNSETTQPSLTPRRRAQPRLLELERSNHGRIRLLDKSDFTIIAVGRSHFFNDSTSSLSNKMSQSTRWSYSSKHTFEMACSYRRPLRMHIINRWNSSLSLPEDSQPLFRNKIYRSFFG